MCRAWQSASVVTAGGVLVQVNDQILSCRFDDLTGYIIGAGRATKISSVGITVLPQPVKLKMRMSILSVQPRMPVDEEPRGEAVWVDRYPPGKVRHRPVECGRNETPFARRWSFGLPTLTGRRPPGSYNHESRRPIVNHAPVLRHGRLCLA